MSDRWEDTQFAALHRRVNVVPPRPPASWLWLWVKVLLATSACPVLAMLIWSFVYK